MNTFSQIPESQEYWKKCFPQTFGNEGVHRPSAINPMVQGFPAKYLCLHEQQALGCAGFGAISYMWSTIHGRPSDPNQYLPI